jgi:hypothetical protein
MKHFFLFFALLTLASCSSHKTARAPLQEQINDLEVKTSQEMHNHANVLLENHPELSESSKLKIKSYLDATMNKHQELKDEESKVIQLMLKNSLTHEKGDNGLDDNKNLKSHLLEIYKSKSSNILDLIVQINNMAKNSEIGEAFKSDIFLFMRDFR